MNISKLLVSALFVCGLHGVAHAQPAETTTPPPAAEGNMDHAAPAKAEKAPAAKHGHGKAHGKKHE